MKLFLILFSFVLAFSVGLKTAVAAQMEQDGGTSFLISQELVDARFTFIKKLSANLKYREALQELLELRNELPRGSSLFVDYWIGLTYRNIAESLREGYMIENEKGELYYRSEIDLAMSSADREALEKRFTDRKNLFTDEELKYFTERLNAVPAENSSDKEEFQTISKFTIVTNPANSFTVVTNRKTTDVLSSNQQSRFIVVSNLIPASEIIKTNWLFKTNYIEVTNFSNTTNIQITTNKLFVTNANDPKKTTTGAPTDTSFESQIYNFYPTGDSIFGALKKIQIQTNVALKTYFSVYTNFYVKTNTVVSSNAAYQKVKVGEDKVTFSSNEQKYWTFSTNKVEKLDFSTNVSVSMSVTTNEERMKVKVVRPLLQVSTNKDSRVYSGNVSFKTLRPLTPASLKYYDLALRWFNKLIAITTGNAFRESASIQKSEIFTDIKEPLLSLESYGFFIRTFPQSKNTPDVMVRRGDVYLDLGKYDESFRTYQEFLELYPKADKRDYVKLKMDYLRMITSRENAALVPSILTELDKQKKQMEALETELKKKEDRLNNLDQIRKQ